MSEILDSLQEISRASREYEKQQSKIYSNIYLPAMRENRKNLKTITQRLENSRAIVSNIRKKFNSRSTQFSFDLRNVRELQWMSMKERNYFFEDDLKINSIDDVAFFKFQLELYTDEKRTVKYPIHPIFYTGSDRDIAKFVRQIFYRENIRNLQIVLNNLENVKWARESELYSYKGLAQNMKGDFSNSSQENFDMYFKYVNHMNVDEMVDLYSKTLISQLKKYSSKIEENYGKSTAVDEKSENESNKAGESK